MNALTKLKIFLTSRIGRVVLAVLLYAPILGLLLLFTSVFDAPIVAVIFAAIFTFFGWKALNRITPDVFLIMPIGGWIAYYVIKILLAFLIGVFIAPLVIGKWISDCIAKGIIENEKYDREASRATNSEGEKK